jgi:CDP-paratose 2-epimerase
LDVKLNSRPLPWRANDQKYFVADNSKAARMLNWMPKKSKEEGIADALAWEISRRPIRSLLD